MKAISEEKNKSFSRKEELTKEEQRMEEEQTKLQSEMAKQKAKEDELIDNAQLIKEKSEQVDEYYLVCIILKTHLNNIHLQTVD